VTVVVDLDERGDVLDPEDGRPVPAAAVPGFLRSRLDIPETATDIVVFAHGWRTSRSAAERRARQFFDLVAAAHNAERYPDLDRWSGYHVIVRWPSMSNPFPSGYRRIRDRAHAMTTEGRAALVLGRLLGYLNTHRRLPGGPPALRSATGQYLHCVGHSFGGRFLVEAVQAAADQRPPTLGWQRDNPRYPYTVDTLLVFQMAARPDVFTDRFARVLTDAPINGPIVLTNSRADRATGLWHRLAEGTPGIGHIGAARPPQHVTSVRLHTIDQPYLRAELDSRIVNVDANWRFRRGRLWHPAGAHSDFWHPESAHMLLSLANLAR
jgi:esterase/lipase superfamily enzyme